MADHRSDPEGQTASARASVALAAGLVAYNTAINSAGLGDRFYTTRNLLAGAGLVSLGRVHGLSLREFGLDPATAARGWRWGRRVIAVVAGGVGLMLALAPRVPAVDALLNDRRADLDGPALTRQTLVRIPLGTATFEEVAFRGVLLGLATREMGTACGVALSSAAFGLWHVGPTLVAVEENDQQTGVAALVVGSVATTTVGGALLSWLRLASGGLLAPVLTHWAINGLGLLAAAYHRR